MKSVNGFSSAVVVMGAVGVLVGGVVGCGIDKSHQGTRGQASGSQFVVASIKASETLVSRMSPMGLPEEKLFNIQACVQDRLGLAPIIDREFRVWAEGDVISVRTDLRGCMTWQERHEFNYLEAEAYFAIERTIEGLTAFRGSETLALKMNPWRDGGSSLIDSRYDQVPEEVTGQDISFKSKISRQSDKASAIKVKQVFFHLRRYRPDLYRLKSDLSLEVAHEYEFRTNVQFVRKTLSGQATETPFRGKIRVHGYLTRQPIPMGGEVREMVASFNDEVEINEDGIINHPMIMTIHDPVAYKARTYFYITFEPVDETNLSLINLMGIDDPHGPFMVELRPTDQDIIDLFSKKKEKILAQKPNLFKDLVDHSQMKELQTEGNPTLQKFSDYLAKSSEGQKNPVTNKDLCEAVFSDAESKEALERCLCEGTDASLWTRWFGCSGEKRFDSQVRDVVVEVQSQPEILSGPVSESLSVSASFEKTSSNSSEAGHKESTSLGVKVSGGISTGFDALEKLTAGIVKAPLSVGLNFDASSERFTAKVSAEKQSSSSGAEQKSSLIYSGESYRLGYRAQVRRCAFFEVKGLGEALATRRMVCSANFDRDVKQSYYFVNLETKRDSVLTDAAAQDNNKHFVVRGKAAYQTLSQLLADKNIKIMYDSQEASGLVNKSRLTEEYPGLLMPAGDD